MGLAFVAVLLTVWVGSHVYLARMLLLDIDLPAPLERLGVIVLALLGASVVAQPIAERLVGPRRARALSWVASLWMGFAFVTMLLLLASGTLTVLAGAALPADSDPVGAARLRGGIVLLVALAVSARALRDGWRPPLVRRSEIELERWPSALDGFRIAQVSDVHIGPLLDRGFARDIVARVAALEPDLIVVTGDLVDGTVAHLRDDVAPLAELHAPHGVFFVTGNHDYYSGVDAWLAEVERLGIRPLRNERVLIETPRGAFELAGVNDRLGALFGPQHASDLDAALEGWTRVRPLVLLAHDPTTFHEAWPRGVDLQISGHTHGGQIWPFGYLVRLAVGFVAGHYRRGGSQLWVSCGTGFWGPPMRLGAAPEITEIVLRAKRQSLAA